MAYGEVRNYVIIATAYQGEKAGTFAPAISLFR